MENLLINAGLTELEAKVYIYLLDVGPSAPKDITKSVNITRTNAYKVLESLENKGLAIKNDVNKKIVYSPTDPSALASLVAEKRNNIIALEQNINQAMQDLRNKYGKKNSPVSVSVKIGKKAIIEAYEDQLKSKEPVYFYKTRADIPFMGYEAMNEIRKLQGQSSIKRFGITPDSTEASLSPDIDKRTNLERSWVDESAYTAPVEWSVAGDTLVIQVFDSKGSSVVIKNKLISQSFKQIWQLTDHALKNDPGYKTRPLKAKRLI